MKRFIPIMLLALVFAASPVLAVETGVGANVKAEVKARLGLGNSTSSDKISTSTKEERKDRIEENKASSTQKRVEFQKEVAERKAMRASKVFLAVIERLERIIGRIESRMAKIEGKGGSTAEAKASLNLAKQNLVDAKAGAEVMLSLDLNGDKAQENFEKVRTAAGEVKADIKLAHRNLTDAIRSLAKGLIEREKNATTTNATTTNE